MKCIIVNISPLAASKLNDLMQCTKWWGDPTEIPHYVDPHKLKNSFHCRNSLKRLEHELTGGLYMCVLLYSCSELLKHQVWRVAVRNRTSNICADQVNVSEKKGRKGQGDLCVRWFIYPKWHSLHLYINITSTSQSFQGTSNVKNPSNAHVEIPLSKNVGDTTEH